MRKPFSEWARYRAEAGLSKPHQEPRRADWMTQDAQPPETVTVEQLLGRRFVLGERGLTALTANRYVEAVSLFFEEYLRPVKGHTGPNPAKLVKPLRQMPPTTPKRAATHAEAHALVTCPAVPAERRAAYALMLETAIRVGTVRALEARDFDLVALTVRVRAEATKGRRDATKPITGALARALGPLLAERAGDESVFDQVRLETRVFYADLKSAGIAQVTEAGKLCLHALKTTALSEAARQHADPYALQRLAEHADLKTTTGYYVRVEDAALREVVEAISPYGSPPDPPALVDATPPPRTRAGATLPAEPSGDFGDRPGARQTNPLAATDVDLARALLARVASADDPEPLVRAAQALLASGRSENVIPMRRGGTA